MAQTPCRDAQVTASMCKTQHRTITLYTHRPAKDLESTSQSRMEQAGVPCEPINDMAEVFEDPQTRHREIALSLPHGRGVAVPSLRSPLRFSATPVVHRASPMLGEHSAQVLQQELGIDTAQLQDLRRRSII